MTKQEALDRIRELEKFIKETDKKKEWVWKPKEGENYWAIRNDGGIAWCEWKDSPHEEMIYSTGNIFKTEEEAEQHLDWLEARAKILRDVEEKNGGRKVDWNGFGQYKYEIYYNYDDETLKVYTTYEAQSLPAGMAYLNKKDAEASMKDLRNEWLTFFGVKEDK